MAPLKKLLAFRLNESLCALDVDQVSQVIQAVSCTSLPHAPGTVIGAIDFHGQVIPLLSIRRKFGFPDRDIAPEDQFIIAQSSSRTVAVAVDEVLQIIERSADKIIPPQTVAANREDLAGVTHLDDGLVLIHDLDTFLTPDQTRELDLALAAEAAHAA